MPDLYDIIKVPDPVLKETAHAIENIDDAVKAQINAMINTMYHGAGIGLAANQVNKLNRVFVMDLPEGMWVHGPVINGIQTIESAYRSGEKEPEFQPNPRAFINPEVVWSSEQKSVYDEGCLSIPQQYGEVIRPAQVRVKFQDINGETHEELFDGLHSHCVQHEIDHLNGILFIDYLSTLKRNMILRRMKKLQKESAVL
ncbi:MAG TPA: peptide deformylase [Alphaproteobacteria bacterium]|nr:peptide deformylase [Alphaproteobacteria bacterium]